MKKSGIFADINGTAVSGTSFTYAAGGTTSETLAFNVTNNGAITQLTIVFGEGGNEGGNEGGDSGETPGEGEDDTVTTVGDGSEANPYTVEDLIALNNPGTTGKWVTGYIVGVINYANGSTLETAMPTTVNTCIAIASAAGETDQTKCVAVQLPAGDIRTALNLVDNPANFGKQVSLYGDLVAYFGMAGVKNTSAYTLGEGGNEGEGGETPDTPGVETEGDGSEMNPYTVADAILLGNPGTTGKWVNGIIVGVMNYVDGTGNVFSATELTTNSNIVIAATAADFGTAYVAVQLPAGKVREDLNLVDRPGNLGKEVSVCGDLIKYCGVTGVKNTTNYNIVGGLAPLPVAETESLTTFVEEQCASNTKIVNPVTVFYQSPDKKYTFITDGTTNLEVYAGGGLTNAYVNGDQLTGIIGKFSYYKNMPQMTPQVDSFGEPTAGTAVQPVEKVLSNVAPADYVVVKNVTIAATVEGDKTTYTATDASGSVVVFDRFALNNIKEGENLTIVGIGAIFEETAQIFPIEITDGESSGIEEIVGENAANVGIYDLQGRKLAAPVKGINIINGKKVLVK